MFPPVYQTISASTAVKFYLGDSPVRFYPAGEAPSKTVAPYATWQVITGVPENYLGQIPDIDQYSIQIDVWAETLTECRDIGENIRDVIEPVCHITSWRGESRQPGTRLYRLSFDSDWVVDRDPISI